MTGNGQQAFCILPYGFLYLDSGDCCLQLCFYLAFYAFVEDFIRKLQNKETTNVVVNIFIINTIHIHCHNIISYDQAHYSKKGQEPSQPCRPINLTPFVKRITENHITISWEDWKNKVHWFLSCQSCHFSKKK